MRDGDRIGAGTRDGTQREPARTERSGLRIDPMEEQWLHHVVARLPDLRIDGDAPRPSNR